jgi:hypothetical protein
MRRCPLLSVLACLPILVLSASVSFGKLSGSIVTWGGSPCACQPPSPNMGFTAVSAGGDFSLGLKTDGSIVAWGGQNVYGERNVPSPNIGFTAIAAGYSHSLGLKTDGSIVAWGRNAFGECNVPVPNTGFTRIAAGISFSLGLRGDGSIVGWGNNDRGQCVPPPDTRFTAIAAGSNFSLGLKTDGSIVAWGATGNGQCNVPSPNTEFTAVAAGPLTGLGLRADGSIVGWGDNDQGECDVPSPNTGFVGVAGGEAHSLGLKADGSIVAWGLYGMSLCDVPSPNTGYVAVATFWIQNLGLLSYAVGACCAPAGTCTATTQAACAPSNSWQGTGTNCVPNPCPTLGACCTTGGGCSLTLEATCVSPSVWHPEWVTCSPNPCPQPPPPGACCDPWSGACSLVLPTACTGFLTWNGADSCTPNPCPTLGACCTTGGGCSMTIQANCYSPSVWYSRWVTCSPNPCPRPYACCKVDGSCVLVTAAECVSQNGNYQGDGTACPPYCRPQSEVTIQSIQLLTYAPETAVTCDNVVVTGAGMFGYFIQEPNADPVFGRKWSGIWVYAPDHTMHKGDLVNLRGMYREYYGQSEIDIPAAGAAGFQVRTGSVPIPAPVVVPMSSVNDTGVDSEAYEGVFIRADATPGALLSLPEYPGLSGKKYWAILNTATGDSISVMHENHKVGDDFIYGTPDPGTSFTHLQGILEYVDDRFRLAPRGCELDFGAPCVPRLRGAYATGSTTVNVQFDVQLDPVTAGTAGNYELASGKNVWTAALDPARLNTVQLTTDALTAGSAERITVSNVKSSCGSTMTPGQVYDFRSGITTIRQIQYVENPAVKDSSSLTGATATIEGRVAALDGLYFYLQEGDGAQWTGLYCRVANTGTLNRGDKVRVSGAISEDRGMTELVYTDGVDNFVKLGVDPDPVVVNILTTADLHFRDATRSAEQWESGLVKLLNATFRDSIPGVAEPYLHEWLLQQGAAPDTSMLDMDGLAANGVVYGACPGNRADIAGVLSYFGDKYRICPRSGQGGDIIELFVTPSCPRTGVDPVTSAAVLDLRQNRPNPFGLETAIAFALLHPSQIRLEVVDVSGRLVRVLAAGSLAAGEHIFQWDGMTENGRHAAAGTYFYRLRCGGKDASRRMVLLK